MIRLKYCMIIVLTVTVCTGKQTRLKGQDMDLYWAVATGNIADTEKSLKAGANPNALNDKENGYTFLMLATERGLDKILILLLKGGAGVNVKDKKGYSALIYAIEKGKLKIAQILLKNKANPNIKDENGATPLMYATSSGNKYMFKLLLDHGADVHLGDKEGWTALKIAQQNKNYEIIKLIHSSLKEK